MSDDRGQFLKNLNIGCLTVSTVFFAVRIYARGFMSRTLGWDDLVASFAWCLLVAASALEILEVSYGSGKHVRDVTPSQLEQFFHIVPTSELLYFIDTGFIRMAIVVFLPRLSQAKKFIRLVWGLAFVIISMSLIGFFIRLAQYKHVGNLWATDQNEPENFTMQQEERLFQAYAAIGIAVDLALLLIPIYLIVSHMKFSATALKVIFLFSFGGFSVVAGIVRLVVISTVKLSNDATYEIPIQCAWTDLQVHVGFWVACFPAMQPVLRRIPIDLDPIWSSIIEKTTKSSYNSSSGSRRRSTWRLKSQELLKMSRISERRLSERGFDEILPYDGLPYDGTGPPILMDPRLAVEEKGIGWSSNDFAMRSHGNSPKGMTFLTTADHDVSIEEERYT